METIQKYFNDLSSNQILQFSKLKALYFLWNSRINVISRKDIENIYLHHVLHSLSVAKIITFTKNTKILDVGTGGGFPGIPLTIIFPEVRFLLIDSIAKKIKVVNTIIQELQLSNCEAKQINALNMHSKFDFVVSRAVSSLPDFYKLTKNLVSKKQMNSSGNGIIYLKGGEIDKELEILKSENQIDKIIIFNIIDYFSESFFETKKIVYIQV